MSSDSDSIPDVSSDSLSDDSDLENDNSPEKTKVRPFTSFLINLLLFKKLSFRN